MSSPLSRVSNNSFRYISIVSYFKTVLNLFCEMSSIPCSSVSSFQMLGIKCNYRDFTACFSPRSLLPKFTLVAEFEPISVLIRSAWTDSHWNASSLPNRELWELRTLKLPKSQEFLILKINIFPSILKRVHLLVWIF